MFRNRVTKRPRKEESKLEEVCGVRFVKREMEVVIVLVAHRLQSDSMLPYHANDRKRTRTEHFNS